MLRMSLLGLTLGCLAAFGAPPTSVLVHSESESLRIGLASIIAVQEKAESVDIVTAAGVFSLKAYPTLTTSGARVMLPKSSLASAIGSIVWDRMDSPPENTMKFLKGGLEETDPAQKEIVLSMYVAMDRSVYCREVSFTPFAQK